MRKLTAAGRSPVAYVLIQGKKRRLGPWGSHEAMHAYREIVNGHDRAPKAPAELGTVADLAGRFMAEASVIYRKHGRPTQSMANVRIVVRLIHAAGLAGTRLDEVGPLWLKMFQRWLAAHPGQRWARATINEYVAIAVRMFAFGVSEEIITEDLIGRLRTVRPLRRGRGVVGRSTPLREERTVEAVERSILRRSCRHLPFELRVLVNLQLLTGMRPI
ncbi:MAG: hypothetical protein KF768_14315, partial [Phycisphaeraceae bacterium]|nr:hypothetical protein [Phycisphaeraceae bacterium]